MAGTQKNNLSSGLKSLRQSKAITLANKFFASPLGVAFFAALTLLSFAFSLEIIFYSLIVAYALYVCVFGEDFFTLIPLFLFCYVSASAKNNPGVTDSSLFFGVGGIVILVFAAVLVVCVLLRIALDETMGFKRLFRQKRRLIWGFLAVGVAYLLSGIGSEHYLQIAGKNLLFALLQFLALFFLYFLFSATVDWEKRDPTYFAWTMLFFGLLVAGELLLVYSTGDIVTDGSIDRGKIYTGWGNYNNVGGMIALSLPFCLYLVLKYKRGFLLMPVASALLVAVFFSGSRTSCLVAVLVFIAAFLLVAIKIPYKKSFWITTGALLTVVAVVCCIFYAQIAELFMKIPAIFNGGNPDIHPDYQGNPAGTGNDYGGLLGLFNDADRFEVYHEGLKVFAQYPVFGESFYQSGFTPYAFSVVSEFSSFFPARWHNTIIQMLAACGSVGILAYLFHRGQTVLLFLKKPSLYKSFVGLGAIAVLLMSLLDCHLFNIGPAFFYSLCLLFAEMGKDKKDAENAAQSPEV